MEIAIKNIIKELRELTEIIKERGEAHPDNIQLLDLYCNYFEKWAGIKPSNEDGALPIQHVRQSLPDIEKEATKVIREHWCSEDEQYLTDKELVNKYSDEWNLCCQTAENIIKTR